MASSAVYFSVTYLMFSSSIVALVHFFFKALIIALGVSLTPDPSVPTAAECTKFPISTLV